MKELDATPPDKTKPFKFNPLLVHLFKANSTLLSKHSETVF